MTKSTSVFLDALRLFAALVVFAGHLSKILYADSVWFPRHAMVIVFFVLSGYVIAYSTLNRKEPILKDYLIARLSRLYSVVIPALLLTALLLVCGCTIHPAYYDAILQEHEPGRFFATALFLQSVWSRNLVPPDNGPFWSLGYEFWYYAAFGIAVFAKRLQWKVVLLLIVCLIVGENVLLLSPIWLGGVGIYLYGNRLSLSRRSASWGLVVTLGLTIFTVFFLPEFPGQVGFLPHLYSAAYLTDWLLGIELVAVIAFYTQALGEFSYPQSVARGVHWAANHTFSLYLYHYPLILFFAALGIFNPQVWWQEALEIGAILALVIALSEVTESKRGLWRKAMESAWARWAPLPITLKAKSETPTL